MNKEYSEPEEKDLNNTSDAIIMDDFNPLDEPILEKEYTKHNVKVDPRDFQNDIPEPSFTPPPMNGGLNSTLSADEKKVKPKEPFNPKVNEMSNKDKHMASSKVADMILTAYEWINLLADQQLQFNERKLAKMVQNGEIDLDVPIPINATTVMSGGEFIQEFNEQSKGTIVVTQEFKEEVRPVLTRVLEKRGIHFNDEQELMYLGFKDMAIKGFMLYQQLQVKKSTLEMLKEAVSTIKAQQGYTPPPPQPTQSTYTPPPPPPQPTYNESYNPDTNVNDFVNTMTGSIDSQPQPSFEYEQPHQEETEMYQEPKPKVKIISEGTKKPIGKRGRPKRK